MRDKTILIVDDEEHILQMLEMNMRARGYRSLTARSAEEALELALTSTPDLILLDVMLPRMDGVELCRLLKEREETKRIPVLMVSAKSEGRDKIAGLRGGADDYITKPFNLEELYLRIEASLRQVDLLSSPQRTSELKLGDLLLDREKYTVQWKGDKVDLTMTEFKILQRLLREQGEIVDKDRLVRDVFDLSPSEMGRTLDVHLRNLRKKLNAAGVDCCGITTIRGQGYRIG